MKNKSNMADGGIVALNKDENKKGGSEVEKKAHLRP